MITSNQIPSPSIAEKLGKSREAVRMTSSIEFQLNPSAFLINQLISRGIGRCCTDDFYRPKLLELIPDFVQALSLDNLKAVAVYRFGTHEEKDKILEVFKKSIESPLFLEQYQRAMKATQQALTMISESDKPFKKSIALGEADDQLRRVLDVYYQAEKQKPYYLEDEYPQ